MRFLFYLFASLLAVCGNARAGDAKQVHLNLLDELSRIRANLTSPLPLGGASLAVQEADGVFRHSLLEGKVVFKSGNAQAINHLANKLHSLAIEEYHFDLNSAAGRARAAAIRALAAHVKARQVAATRAAEQAEKAMEKFITFREAADSVISPKSLTSVNFTSVESINVIFFSF